MKRRGLCIGINDYPGTDMDLQGCVNDAKDWAAVLEGRGFEVRQLLDKQATKAGLVAGLRRLIGDARAGDVVVVTFSGHGTYAPDAKGGDEADGYDEGLCPHDVKTAGPLIDDEIHALFAACPAGAHLVLISDSCHSGTVTRDAGDGLRDPQLPVPRFMPIANWRGAAPEDFDARRVRGRVLKKALRAGEADLLLAGCEEGPKHFSYDTQFDGRPVGAFSYFARQQLAKLPAGATYEQWMKAVTPDCLPNGNCNQRPQIVGSAAARKREIFA